ncbi:MAG: rhodanese-like domain-containing protein [Chloroflexi bacterium]|nr:rhodanese-like domain-containing protein [Chloroflexota bacterium]
MADYAAPELLADTAWLAEHLNDPNVRVIEMTQDSAPFAEGHIPGAVVSPDWQIKGSENTRLVAPPDEAKAWFESVGIGDDTLVIGYDRARNRDAARLWWVLTYYGHTNVKVLNGGWKKWAAEGRPTEMDDAAAPAGSSTFTPKPANHEIESTVDKLKAAIGQDDTLIWDIRGAVEYTGEVDRGNSHSGHVPGAVNLEWVNLVNGDDTFKSADDLAELLAPLGCTYEKTIHIY